MPADNLTFLIGFAAVFGGLAWYLWHLEREVSALRRRVDDAERAAPAATSKTDPEEAPL